MTSAVSSSARVVWVRYDSWVPSGRFNAATSAGVCTNNVDRGATPSVPSVSSCPACPMKTTVSPRAANRAASAWTFATSGQVASTTCSPRSSAPARTAGETPCAENTTTAPGGGGSGISSRSSTNTAPRSRNSATTTVLCTICLRTYTGPSATSSTRLTVSIARSTPAQNDRGDANSTVTSPEAYPCATGPTNTSAISTPGDISVATTRSGLGIAPHRAVPQ